jgi:hypothetical protein
LAKIIFYFITKSLSRIRLDELVKSLKRPFSVIPAKAEIQPRSERDRWTFYETIILSAEMAGSPRRPIL